MLKTVAKIYNHIRCVQSAIFYISNELQNRAMSHDSSKFSEDEINGYSRFEDMPDGLEYGSMEYKSAMAKVMDGNNCFELHSKRNDHHPEFYDSPSDMGFLQVIEMVCDWHGAHEAYGNDGGWLESVEINIEKYRFSESQKWLVHEVSLFLDGRAL